MIEAEIQTQLETICPNRVFLGIADCRTKPPYICYSPVSSTYDDVLSGQSNYEKRCFQVDVYSTDYIEALTLINNARTQLSTLGISDLTRSSSRESETRLYRETLEFFY